MEFLSLHNDILGLQRVTKTLYMTLGPKFFSCNKMAKPRRTRHIRKHKALILKAFGVDKLKSIRQTESILKSVLNLLDKLKLLIKKA